MALYDVSWLFNDVLRLLDDVSRLFNEVSRLFENQHFQNVETFVFGLWTPLIVEKKYFFKGLVIYLKIVKNHEFCHSLSFIAKNIYYRKKTYLSCW